MTKSADLWVAEALAAARPHCSEPQDHLRLAVNWLADKCQTLEERAKLAEDEVLDRQERLGALSYQNDGLLYRIRLVKQLVEMAEEILKRTP